VKKLVTTLALLIAAPAAADSPMDALPGHVWEWADNLTYQQAICAAEVYQRQLALVTAFEGVYSAEPDKETYLEAMILAQENLEMLENAIWEGHFEFCTYIVSSGYIQLTPHQHPVTRPQSQ
jgi:hypothetical protein